MSALLEKYGLEKLSREELWDLYEELEVSLDAEQPEASDELTEAEQAMITERLARIDADLARGIDRSIPGEVVFARIDAKLTKT